MMMGAIRHMIRGCGYLEGYGSHPGNGVLVAFVAMGAAAASRGGLRGALLGATAMLIVFGPMYLWGAYERGRDGARRALRQDERSASTASPATAQPHRLADPINTEGK